MRILIAALALAITPVAANAAANDWSGPYLGMTAGIGSMSNTMADHAEYFTYGFSQASAIGGVFGATIGQNYKIGTHGVAGIEADFNGSTMKAKNDWVSFESYQRSAMPWFGTFRGRAGLAVDSALIYVTGGLALVNNKDKVYYNASGCGANSFDVCKSSTNVGLAIGAGAEYALAGNWSVKAEYLYIDSPVNRHHIPGAYCGDYCDVTFNNDMHIIRLGVNYHFGK